MNSTPKFVGGVSGVVLAAALALGVCGCKPTSSTEASLPPPEPVTDLGAPAPAASDLPAAAPVRLATSLPPSERYYYPDRALAFSRALYDTPPTYAFDYGPERPWVWRAADRSYAVAERLPD